MQLEPSTATSVLGGGEDEHELEHEGSHHAAASMNLSMRVEDTEHACVNTTPMNGGGSSPLRTKTTPVNGGGSSKTSKTAIDFTATQLMLDKASIRVAELGNQLLRATSDLMTADLEGESTIIEGSAPKSTKAELLTAVETKLNVT